MAALAWGVRRPRPPPHPLFRPIAGTNSRSVSRASKCSICADDKPADCYSFNPGFGGGYHHIALGGPPDAGMPRFEKEHLEELPAALRGAVGAELAGMLLDDCRGSAPTQLRHELRLLRQFLAAEADKLAALKELRRKAPSGDAWTEGQVTVQRVHEWTDTREHLNEWAVEGAAVA